jgi:DNA-binding HxlR family transcriptional regulator
MREVFARLGDKWSMLLLLLLRAGPFGHATLRRLVTIIGSDARISQRMFTLRLRSLERDGLIVRTITPVAPPRVTYALTDLGRELMARVDDLMGWIGRNAAAIRAARDVFDSAVDD